MVAVVSASFMTSACTSSPTPPPPKPSTTTLPNWPPLANGLRFVWSAENGIDLTSGLAVPVRAYFESKWLAEHANTLAVTYPGFSRAVTYKKWQSGSLVDVRINNPSPILDSPMAGGGQDYRQQPLFGNVDERIMQITPVADEFEVIVCRIQDYFYVQTGSDQYTLWSNQVDNRFNLERIDLSNHDPRSGPNPPPSPTAPQRGPLPAPLADVFGPWHVTGWTADGELTWNAPDGSSTSTANYQQLQQQCLADVPIPDNQRPGAFPATRTTPPAIQPATPGWPDAAQ